MKIAILSDIHDNIWKLEAALTGVRDADAMIFCGDLCSPFVVGLLGNGFGGPIHIVFGNNDGDQYRITQIAKQFEHVYLYGEFFRDTLGGKTFAVNHFDNIAVAVAGTGEYDVVCYGHNHVYKIEPVGETLTINPGALMGYNPGTGSDVPATFVIYDTDTGEPASYQVEPSGEVVPYQP